MHGEILAFAAFGWLTFTGTLHFAIDVASQYVRGKRGPGPETTLTDYAQPRARAGAVRADVPVGGAAPSRSAARSQCCSARRCGRSGMAGTQID
ncbi:hypothetical protein [Sphingobium sp. SCG-1]|uniref:hypothetical protein n=1 Tax=Sphingobium sp. SCG-1 TaxID=2072936 RepID=UPI0011AB6F02|nr:hypothetical protein [Sphingobium sp. SCG-1]